MPDCYDNEYTQYYYECCVSNAWARETPELCGCKGTGWWLSNVDTWHKCPFHKGEDYSPDFHAPELDEIARYVFKVLAEAIQLKLEGWYWSDKHNDIVIECNNCGVVGTINTDCCCEDNIPF